MADYDDTYVCGHGAVCAEDLLGCSCCDGHGVYAWSWSLLYADGDVHASARRGEQLYADADASEPDCFSRDACAYEQPYEPLRSELPIYACA